MSHVKGPRRIAFNILPMASALLFAASATIWIRSYFVRDAFPEFLRGNGHSVRSWHGRLFILGFWTAPSPKAQLLIPVRTPSIADVKTGYPDDTPTARRTLQSARQQGNVTIIVPPRITLNESSVGNAFGFSRASITVTGPGPQTIQYTILSIPFWAICLASSFLPIGWWIARLRRRARSGEGRCPACGYDLRATPDRCPECGRMHSPAPAVHEKQ